MDLSILGKGCEMLNDYDLINRFDLLKVQAKELKLSLQSRQDGFVISATSSSTVLDPQERTKYYINCRSLRDVAAFLDGWRQCVAFKDIERYLSLHEPR